MTLLFHIDYIKNAPSLLLIDLLSVPATTPHGLAPHSSVELPARHMVILITLLLMDDPLRFKELARK